MPGQSRIHHIQPKSGKNIGRPGRTQTCTPHQPSPRWPTPTPLRPTKISTRNKAYLHFTFDPHSIDSPPLHVHPLSFLMSSISGIGGDRSGKEDDWDAFILETESDMGGSSGSTPSPVTRHFRADASAGPFAPQELIQGSCGGQN